MCYTILDGERVRRKVEGPPGTVQGGAREEERAEQGAAVSQGGVVGH